MEGKDPGGASVDRGENQKERAAIIQDSEVKIMKSLDNFVIQPSCRKDNRFGISERERQPVGRFQATMGQARIDGIFLASKKDQVNLFTLL
jgi:hypothetical protein